MVQSALEDVASNFRKALIAGFQSDHEACQGHAEVGGAGGERGDGARDESEVTGRGGGGAAQCWKLCGRAVQVDRGLTVRGTIT